MTRDELFNIARRMDEETREMIDQEVEEKLEILKQGDLTQEELEQMEEYLYASLVLQEFLNGEYELLEEERQELFDEMEEMYNKYADLLVRARLEENVSKKKRMTLELMKIREQLMDRKGQYKDIKQRMKENRDKHNKLKELNKNEKMKEYSKGGKGLDGLPAKKETREIDKLKRELDSVRDQVQTNTNNGRKLEDTINRIYGQSTGSGLTSNTNKQPSGVENGNKITGNNLTNAQRRFGEQLNNSR